MTTPDPRLAYAAGLRILADEIARNPSMPLPHFGTEYSPGLIFTDSAEEWDAVASLVEYESHEIRVEATDRHQFRLHGRIGGVRVTVIGAPQWACVMVGNEPVSRERWEFRGQPVGVTA